MLNKEILKEMCLVLTGGYNDEMVKRVEQIDMSNPNNELMSSFEEKIFYLVVIIDTAEAIKVLYDAIEDEIVHVKRFSLCSF